MRNTERSLTEIAFMVGYDDYTYFNKVFRKMMSISPREFRNQLEDQKELKKKKCAGILLSILMFISSGCTENHQEDTEIRKPVTISILAGQSTSDAGTEDMIE